MSPVQKQNTQYPAQFNLNILFSNIPRKLVLLSKVVYIRIHHNYIKFAFSLQASQPFSCKSYAVITAPLSAVSFANS